MLVIRLQRVGKKHQASFRIVLQDSRWKPQGKSLELLGFYNPHSKEKQIQAERVKFWLEKGAQPSATLHNMFVDFGVLSGPKVKAGGAKNGEGIVQSLPEGAPGTVKKESEAKPAEAVTEAPAEPAVVEPVESEIVEEPVVEKEIISSKNTEAEPAVEDIAPAEEPEEKEMEKEIPLGEEAKKDEAVAIES